MKTLILGLLLFPSIVFAQASNESPVKLKNWRERVYRGYRVEDVETAKKRLAHAQDTLDRYRAMPSMSYPQYMGEQEGLVSKYQAELAAAQTELTKLDETLANPETRKAFNKEAKNLFKQRFGEIAASAARTSSYPSYTTTLRTYRHYRIDCYSGGYGRYFWARCTTRSY